MTQTTTVPLVDAVPLDLFAEAFAAARVNSDLVRDMTSGLDYWSEHGQGTTFYLSADWSTGFAIRADGELVYVFSMVKGRGDAIMATAVAAGARRLDCFDGYLPGLYARHGFLEVRREANWTPGGADVVYMIRP